MLMYAPKSSFMKEQKLAAINDLSSPLFRIVSLHNEDEVSRRRLHNNMCAFHIGKGYLLTVAHNLRSEAKLLLSITADRFESEVLANLDGSERQSFNQWYTLDPKTNKRYINPISPEDERSVISTLGRINFDTRWVTLYQRQIAKPYLLIQQRSQNFYNNPAAHHHFDPSLIFFDNVAQRQSYLIELELINAFYENDVALYKIINVHHSIIDLIPSFQVDSEFYDTSNGDFFCLQSAPSDMNPGRMLNEANIEGIIDQFSPFGDRIGGNYNLEGLRYLIKGYFRFGSSGAPYIKFDPSTNSFKVNAIQSEACAVQLTINNARETNSQWVKAIATPLFNVMQSINQFVGN